MAADARTSEKGLYLQNVIAVIWDFDKTLSPQYMQSPLFAAYGVDEDVFWREVNALPAYYGRAGVSVQRDTCYLGHLITYVRAGLLPGLNNARLRELGGKVALFSSIPELFDRMASELLAPDFREGDLRLEHYVVSTGLAEMIRGSPIAPKLAGIWASEFIETPAPPGFDAALAPAPGEIMQIAGIMDNTGKTRAIFEINKGVNKGVNKGGGIHVNDLIPEQDRRVPIQNMIYVADGPSDIPSFSVIRKHGGLAYAVYQTGSEEQFAQAANLQATSRVDDYGPADYAAGSQTDMWLRLQVRNIAARIMADRRRAQEQRVIQRPRHSEETPPANS